MKAIHCHASNALWLLLQTIIHSHPPWLMQTHILLCGRPQHTSGLTYWEWGFMVRIKISKEFLISLVAQTVKHLPTMWETRIQSLGQEGPLEKEMAPHSSTPVWKIPWTEEPGRLQSMGSLRVGYDWATFFLLFLQTLRSVEFPFLSELNLFAWPVFLCPLCCFRNLILNFNLSQFI